MNSRGRERLLRIQNSKQNKILILYIRFYQNFKLFIFKTSLRKWKGKL